MDSPLVFIIFGATGDLTNKKLMPALFSLYERGDISQQLYIIGVGRRELSRDQFRDLMATSIRSSQKSLDGQVLNRFLDGIYYEQGFFEDALLYQNIIARLATFDEQMRACVPRFFYLATPPQNYETILTHLHQSKLSEGCGQGSINYTRVLIEKPFGRDLETARKLDTLLAAIFDERQLYRIDHYLGKETVQNILAFRFANGIFEPTWNSQFIDHVQIHLLETDGVGTRGAFYDGVGTLRDVVQNHIMEMLALIAMECPDNMNALSIREKRNMVLHAVRMEDPTNHGVRGQYAGYTKEKNIDPLSRTETYVALKFFIDTPRWQGVPFYIRAGKHMQRKATEISLHYKKPLCTDDVCFFRPDAVYENVLAIRVQPHEGISLRLMTKEPGSGMRLTPTEMEFDYDAHFQDITRREAYERLLSDVVGGDQTLFTSTSEIDASWKPITQIMQAWTTNNEAIPLYEPGTFGPPAGDELIEHDGRHWFLHEDTVK